MKIISALVHCFTASGMIAIMLSLDAVWRGDAQLALLWLGGALVIDGLDGPLARWAKVSDNLPHIDGATLDLVIDYASYCLVPALIIYRFGLVPEGYEIAIAALILVASLYVFSNRELKTEEMIFAVFPPCGILSCFISWCLRLPPCSTPFYVSSSQALFLPRF